MRDFWKSAVLQTICASLLGTAFCLFAVALLAVFVRAFAPSQATIAVCCQCIKCAGAFLFALICVRGERALFKGAAAGFFTVLLTTLVFGAIGGFHLSLLFPVWLLLGVIFGAAGAVCGKKLRKE